MTFAFVGGALAVLNPCGFPLLVAHLSFAFRGEATTREGLARGTAVAIGFVSTLALFALPLALGLRQIVRFLPGAGLAIGVVLTLIGLTMLFGGRLSLPARFRPRPLDGSIRSALLLGAAQGVIALGCTLPVFLAVVGTASTAGGIGDVLATVGAYAAGSVAVLVVLSATAATAGRAVASRLHGATRHVSHAGTALLTGAGVYLTYFWARLLLADSSLGGDPVVGRVQSFSSWLYRVGSSADAAFLAAALAAAFSVVLLSVVWRTRNGSGPSLEQGGRADG